MSLGRGASTFRRFAQLFYPHLTLVQQARRLLPFGTALALLGGFALGFTGASQHFQGGDPLRDYSIGLVVALLILLTIPGWPVPASHRRVLAELWLVRIGVTLGFMLLYEAYYPVLDAHHYFRAGSATEQLTSLVAAGDGTANVTALAALFNKIMPASYHATKVWFALLGLLGVYAFYRAATLYLGHDDPRLLYVLGLFPGILFWGSILGKDPVVLLGTGIFVLGVVAYALRPRPGYLVLGAIGLIVVGLMRVWLIAILVPPLGVFLLRRNGGAGQWLIFGALVVTVAILAVQLFIERFGVGSLSDLVRTTNEISGNFATGGSRTEVTPLAGPVDLLIQAPMSAFTALFRPLPGEVLNAFGLLAGLESALMLYLFIKGWLRRGWRRVRSSPILLWIVITLGLWGAIYGFVSAGNLGTAVRYRLQVMPLLVLLALYVSQPVAPGRGDTTPVKPRTRRRTATLKERLDSEPMARRP
ncbi:MAG: hypothetical protein ACFCUJ_12395 [Thiotrichales bacterium]